MVRVNTFEDLGFWLKAFSNSNIDLLILEGAGATGKSFAIEEALEGHDYLRILSHVSPMQLFVLGYAYKDKFLVFDDTENLIQSSDCLGLLRQFAESRPEKEIAWFTSGKRLENLETPSSYTTRSKTVIICNSFRNISKRIQALQTRGFLIQFQPTPEEIIRKLQSISISENGLPQIQRQEIFEFLEKHGKYATNLNLRSYSKAAGLLKETNGTGLWKEKMLEDLGVSEKLRVLDRLLSNLPSDKERLDKWVNYHGWSRRSYYENKKRLCSAEVSRI